MSNNAHDGIPSSQNSRLVFQKTPPRELDLDNPDNQHVEMDTHNPVLPSGTQEAQRV